VTQSPPPHRRCAAAAAAPRAGWAGSRERLRAAVGAADRLELEAWMEECPSGQPAALMATRAWLERMRGEEQRALAQLEAEQRMYAAIEW
jgi:hypothetical protein